MIAHRPTVALAALFLVAASLAASDETSNRASALQQADALFRAGKFAEAETAYSKIASSGPPSDQVLTRLGQLALFSNRLAKAQEWLNQALQLNPQSRTASALLAEVFVRQDQFVQAVPLLKAAGRQAAAATLESFGNTRPYQIEGAGEQVSLPFVVTDPLPLVRVRMNGGAEVNLFIDTGAAELVLDPEFAKQLGIKTYGTTSGTFAGGKHADVVHGRIDSIQLAGWTVRHVPVALLNTRQYSKPVFGGRRVDGIIGTVFLYHFLATLDYPHARLLLARKKEHAQAAVTKREDVARIPFWMAGDHYIVAWGRINHGDPVLLFVDTGLAGAGVALANSTIQAAGIKLIKNQPATGVGGGGKVSVVPFLTDEVALGNVVERDVRGFAHVFPLEDTLGFHLAGIISHRFFRPYALTFDFTTMHLSLTRGGT